MTVPEPPTMEDSTRTRVTWLVLGIGVIMGGVFITFLLRQPAAIEGVVIYGRQLRGHDNDLVLTPAGMPPVGGVHTTELQECGIYSEPIPDARAIHSLEHGAVWITYRADLPPADVEFLQALVREESFLLLSPYPTQEYPLVLSAWGVQLPLDRVNDPRLSAFIARYRLGPTAPEVGAACNNGLGNSQP